MDVSLRRELGAHLRAARAVVTPQDVGLSGGGRRRAPGLRREEVAALAGVSVAWYTWLEQGRVTTSRQVVDAVCRALRMGPDAHRHALSLAGFLPTAPLAGQGRAAGSPESRKLIDSWRTTPSLLLDERLDIMAGNAAHHRLWGDPGDLPDERRNLLLWLASGPPGANPVADPEPLLRGLYEHFRTAVGHAPDDRRALDIIRLLHQERPDAAHWWQCRAVASFRPTTVEATNAAGTGPGTLTLTFSLLRPVADADVLLLTQTPDDSATAELLERLATAH
ncbi:helix-turn-helix transcriptional regulator [Streptomyces sp. ME19-01-6]|uniref:helix-turn-helix domain-containing protein n=1 Tax=Streptomyces sp. ME19-01-6 TaxID=3028686 RepID=UPI0029AA9C16|nr:helix-turn-helix transcriptional regulator [Streptomyces sp. ME19-01-6]MDX3228986.1 helix-turn-helix transcriptional regulator [Streptomyces sp. ME19-01-6]